MAVKYVDIKKVDENGNILITKTLTPQDIEAINGIGSQAQENKENLDTLTQNVSALTETQNAKNTEQDTKIQQNADDLAAYKKEVDETIKTLGENSTSLKSSLTDEIAKVKNENDANILSVKKRMEDIYNNGIDEVQQKRIEALEKVDVEQIARIDDAVKNIDELEKSGLSNFKDLQADTTKLSNRVDENIASLVNADNELDNSKLEAVVSDIPTDAKENQVYFTESSQNIVFTPETQPSI